MIHETELTLFVPSPELLVRLASGDRPLGIRAGPPKIKVLRETYFDTSDHALRRRGMTCKLRQVEGEHPDLVVTVGEGPDSEGITSRNRMTASAVGFGIFETLRSDSEAALQVRKFVDPAQLRPQIALDIQRLGRVCRSPVLRRATLLLFFDRINVQAGRASAIFHEMRIRRRLRGGPEIRDLGQELRDRHHLFPDGLSTLQRAYRILAMEGRQADAGLSPYALSLALAVFREGSLGLVEKGSELVIPTFRGSGEDAARALSTDLLGRGDLEILRLGSTEPREGRPMLELWALPDPDLSPDFEPLRNKMVWYPWPSLLEDVGRRGLRSAPLLSSLLLLTRKRVLGQLPWVSGTGDGGTVGPALLQAEGGTATPGGSDAHLRRLGELAPLLRSVEDRTRPLRERLRLASELSRGISRFFLQDVAEIKGRVLSHAPSEGSEEPSLLLDLLSIKIRGVMDRLYGAIQGDLLPGLEAAGVHVRAWSGLMREDRRVLQELFASRYLPPHQGAEEWGPSFIPEMPSVGCAAGLTARSPGGDRTRFFHVVLADDTPSFLSVPGTSLVVPLEEVVRGYFFLKHPEVERGETHTFRFTTAEVAVRRPAGSGEAHAGGSEKETTGGGDAEGEEARCSVVLRVIVRREMSELYQAHLLRALERQVSRKTPLIGWPDLYPVNGPLDLAGLERLLPEE